MNFPDLELQDGCFNSMSSDLPGFSLDKDQVYNIPLCIDGTFCYINEKFSCVQKSLSLIFEAFPVGRPEADYYVIVVFEKGNFVNKKTVKAIIMKGENDRSGLEVVTKQNGNVE